MRLFKKATQKDIAREAGVSVTTVSNVLNNKNVTSYSEETRNEILRLADEMNYEIDMTAKNLVTRESKTIAVLMPSYMLGGLHNYPFYFHVISGVEYKATDMGCDVMIRYVKENETVDELVSWARGRMLKGIIIVGEISKHLIIGLHKLNVTLTLIDNYTDFEFKNVFYINTMDEQGGLVAAKHLIDCGYKKLCILTSSITGEQVDSYRYQGFAAMAHNHGISCDLIVVAHTVYQEGFDISYELKRMGIDGVFATSDNLALGVVDGLTKLGVKVPEDVGVVGFDDFARSRENWLPLTTIHQDALKKGELAVKTLFNTDTPIKRLKVSVGLMKRQTTRDNGGKQ